MTTGALVNGSCAETTADAVDLYFSTLPPFSYFDSSIPALVSVSYAPASGVPASWLKITNTAGVISSVSAVPPAFPSCFAPSESFAYGADFAFAVVSLLIVAMGVRACSKALA